MFHSLIEYVSKQRRKKKHQLEEDKKAASSSCPITWRQLLESSGGEIWNIRNFLMNNQEKDDDDEDEDDHIHGLRQLPNEKTVMTISTVGRKIRSGYPSPSTVCILSNATEFQFLEDNHGLDKGSVNATTVHSALPLTRCVGKEWELQRKLIQKSFSDIMSLSLEAAGNVQWKIDGDNTKKIDFKQEVLMVSLQWLVGVFRGESKIREDSGALEEAMLSHWKAIRSRNKKPKEIQKTYKILVEKLDFKNDGYLLQEIYSAFTDGESTIKATEKAEVNSVYAMMAAFDAVQSLVFWTISNLSQDKTMWEACHSSILQDTDGEQQKIDLDGLVTFKKQSTRNESMNLSGLSILALAVIETVRVYPPIWTLPRILKDDGGALNVVKLDVLAANAAIDRKWNPHTFTPLSTCPAVASFGIGKRHCPAGTAALVAAYSVISNFVTHYAAPSECEPGKTVASAYLGPTLCTEGPQFFYIEALKNDIKEE